MTDDREPFRPLTVDEQTALIDARSDYPESPAQWPNTVEELMTQAEHEHSALALLLDRLHDYHVRYVAFANEHQPVVLALWDAHTWAIDAFDVTPRLYFTSAVASAGKSTAQESVGKVARDPLETYTATPAAVYRFLQQRPRTVMIDEADTQWTPNGSDDRAVMLRGLLDAGHRRGKKVAVCVAKGREQVPTEFETFSPATIAGLGKLPVTLESRSIVIRMRRRTAVERVERFRWRQVTTETAPLRAELKRWATKKVTDLLRRSRPAVPSELSDRMQDCWEPLLAIAELAGGYWPARARAAAVALSAKTADDDDETIGTRLLADVRDVWCIPGHGPNAWVATVTLLERLNALEESPWPTWGVRNDGLNAHQLARLLRPFGISSKQSPDGNRHRGYRAFETFQAFHQGRR
jgi:hypothetical protein